MVAALSDAAHGQVSTRYPSCPPPPLSDPARSDHAHAGGPDDSFGHKAITPKPNELAIPNGAER